MIAAALLGPRIGYEDVRVSTAGVDLVLLLDVSQSMDARDLGTQPAGASQAAGRGRAGRSGARRSGCAGRLLRCGSAAHSTDPGPCRRRISGAGARQPVHAPRRIQSQRRRRSGSRGVRGQCRPGSGALRGGGWRDLHRSGGVRCPRRSARGRAGAGCGAGERARRHDSQPRRAAHRRDGSRGREPASLRRVSGVGQRDRRCVLCGGRVGGGRSGRRPGGDPSGSGRGAVGLRPPSAAPQRPSGPLRCWRCCSCVSSGSRPEASAGSSLRADCRRWRCAGRCYRCCWCWRACTSVGSGGREPGGGALGPRERVELGFEYAASSRWDRAEVAFVSAAVTATDPELAGLAYHQRWRGGASGWSSRAGP